jgi:hypothetical protein
MMRRLFALAALALLPALASAQGAREPFPHARHAKLFPHLHGVPRRRARRRCVPHVPERRVVRQLP